MYTYEGNREITWPGLSQEILLWLLYPYQLGKTHQASQQGLCGSFALL